jgi:hypothetical protein
MPHSYVIIATLIHDNVKFFYLSTMFLIMLSIYAFIDGWLKTYFHVHGKL